MEDMIHGIKIQGSSDFVLRTREAFEKLTGTTSFEEIRPYIAVIKEAQRSGMRAYGEQPTYEVGQPTWRHSPVWYAGTIVHDGYHSKLYLEAKATNQGHEPDAETWTGTEAEKRCLESQLQALGEMGADEHVVGYVNSLMENPTYEGVHRSWADYEKRWW